MCQSENIYSDKQEKHCTPWVFMLSRVVYTSTCLYLSIRLVFNVYRPTVFSGSRACSATLFAVSRWKRACSRTENYGKVSKATCIRIDIIRTYRFQSIRKNYIVKFTTCTECIISWLSVLYALNGRKAAIWILCRYEKMWDLTYLTSIYIISSVWV